MLVPCRECYLVGDYVLHEIVSNLSVVIPFCRSCLCVSTTNSVSRAVEIKFWCIVGNFICLVIMFCMRLFLVCALEYLFCLFAGLAFVFLWQIQVAELFKRNAGASLGIYFYIFTMLQKMLLTWASEYLFCFFAGYASVFLWQIQLALLKRKVGASWGNVIFFFVFLLSFV